MVCHQISSTRKLFKGGSANERVMKICSILCIEVKNVELGKVGIFRKPFC